MYCMCIVYVYIFLYISIYMICMLDEQVPRRLCLDLTPGLNRNTDPESKPEPRTKPEMGRRSALRPRTCIFP